MASKTISIDIEAYERLRRARRERGESFSMVIKRAFWPEPPRTAGALLEAVSALLPVDESVINRLDLAQHDTLRNRGHGTLEPFAAGNG